MLYQAYPVPGYPPHVRPAGQAAPEPPPVGVAPDGRITGVDGMLNQIAGALADQAGPMIARDVLPILQQDRALQREVGSAAGREMAKPLWVLAGVAALYVGWRVWGQKR